MATENVFVTYADTFVGRFITGLYWFQPVNCHRAESILRDAFVMIHFS